MSVRSSILSTKPKKKIRYKSGVGGLHRILWDHINFVPHIIIKYISDEIQIHANHPSLEHLIVRTCYDHGLLHVQN
jgi:hypothetical protein